MGVEGVGVMNPCEIVHENQPENTGWEILMQNKRHEAQYAYPGETPVIMKRLDPVYITRAAYTIPNLFYPGGKGMSRRIVQN